MNNLTTVCESKIFIQKMNNVYDLYIKYGARSNKNINYFHNYIKTELEKIFNLDIYKIELEYKVPSLNSSGFKKCDIVIIKNEIPYIILPVKIIKSNYKQNKNNSWENLTGELMQLLWANSDIHIIPINIFMNKTPYLDNNGKIIKFENISYDDISIYETLKNKKISFDLINYIIDVEHNNIIDEKFTKPPIILNFNDKTKFRSMNTIFNDLV
jgi:hypothetical protein